MKDWAEMLFMASWMAAIGMAVVLAPIVAANMAERRSRSFWGWLAMGVCFSWVTVLALWALRPLDVKPPRVDGSGDTGQVLDGSRDPLGS